MVKKYIEYITESLDLDKQLLDASQNGDVNKIKELLDSGADKEVKDDDGWTPLAWASNNGHTEIVKLLLDSDADIESEDNNGWTPLILASWCGHTEIVKLLLDSDADIESEDNNGWTPLILASINGKTEIVKLLLEYGADIKVYNNANNSCLDYKCKNVWTKKYTQELIISGQPQNIEFFDDKIGILPSLKKKYKEVIEMSELGIFG